jgi:hypothetical protein
VGAVVQVPPVRVADHCIPSPSWQVPDRHSRCP